MIQRRILWTAWSASAVLLKRQTNAAAPKHMAKWNQRVTPAAPATKVPECDGCLTGHCR